MSSFVSRIVIAVVLLLISALVIWIPIIALLVFGGVIANWLRRHFVRPPL